MEDDRTEAQRLADQFDMLAACDEFTVRGKWSLRIMDECPPLKDAARLLREQAAEIERLKAALKQANSQAEHFEREWYLRGDELERLRAEAAKRLPGQRTLDELRREIGHLQSELVQGVGLTLTGDGATQPLEDGR